MVPVPTHLPSCSDRLAPSPRTPVTLVVAHGLHVQAVAHLVRAHVAQHHPQLPPDAHLYSMSAMLRTRARPVALPQTPPGQRCGGDRLDPISCACAAALLDWARAPAECSTHCHGGSRSGCRFTGGSLGFRVLSGPILRRLLHTCTPDGVRLGRDAQRSAVAWFMHETQRSHRGHQMLDPETLRTC